MKASLSTGLLLAICVLLVFVLPHTQRAESGDSANTLGHTYWQFFSQPSDIKSAPLRIVYFLGGVIAVFSTIFPAFLAPILNWASPAYARRVGGVLVLLGLLVAVGAIINVIMIVVFNLNVSMGGGGHKQKVTPVFWAIPVVQLTAALTAIAAGVSPRLLGTANRLLGN